MNRHHFLKTVSTALLGTLVSSSESGSLFAQEAPIRLEPIEFPELPSPDFFRVSHSPIQWTRAAPGLEFSRVPVVRDGELVDIIAALRIDPERNTLRVFHGYDPRRTTALTIEGWQERTGAIAMVNGGMYMAEPVYMPVALVKTQGRPLGPARNRAARGMIGANPDLRKIDLIDFTYEYPAPSLIESYPELVTHWPILLDRNGQIRVEKSLWQANRTVAAKSMDGRFLFLTTEGGFFTLFNFGRFLKESNDRQDRGFQVHTAMNLDGGYEANMVLRTSTHEYTTYGEFETYGPGRDATVRNMKIPIPGVIGVHPI